MVQTYVLNATYECARSTAAQQILIAQMDTSQQGRVRNLPACTPECLLLGCAAQECLWLMSHWAEQQMRGSQLHLAGSWPDALVPAPGVCAG